MPYVWDPQEFVYRDEHSGDIVNHSEIQSALQMSLDHSFEHVAIIADALGEGDVDPNDAQVQIREEIEAAYIRQFMLGKGGKDNMDIADWLIVGGLLATQFQYLRRFMNQLTPGVAHPREISPGEIGRRLNMYVNSSRQAYSHGSTRNKCHTALPAHPGDGTTDCLSNCCCDWSEIKHVFDNNGNFLGCNAYWTLGPCKHCQHCPNRAAQWSPLWIPLNGQIDVNFSDSSLFR